MNSGMVRSEQVYNGLSDVKAGVDGVSRRAPNQPAINIPRPSLHQGEDSDTAVSVRRKTHFRDLLVLFRYPPHCIYGATLLIQQKRKPTFFVRPNLLFLSLGVFAETHTQYGLCVTKKKITITHQEMTENEKYGSCERK